ncbi:hypothetical protein [Desulfurobacterium sp.]
MKKLLLTIAASFAVVNSTYAQETTTLSPSQNLHFTSSAGINPASLLFGIFDFEMESYLYQLGKNTYPIFGCQFYNYSDNYWDIKATGITVGIKNYLEENYGKIPEGTYIKTFLTYAYASATYSDYYTYSSASASIFGIGLNIGYRWNFGNENRFYIAPETGITYIMDGKLVASNGDTYDLTGPTLSGGLILGYTW